MEVRTGKKELAEATEYLIKGPERQREILLCLGKENIIRALRKGYPVYFKLSAMFLTQSKGYRTQRLKSKTQIK